jgi:hypothetical protein
METSEKRRLVLILSTELLVVRQLGKNRFFLLMHLIQYAEAKTCNLSDTSAANSSYRKYYIRRMSLEILSPNSNIAGVQAMHHKRKGVAWSHGTRPEQMLLI